MRKIIILGSPGSGKSTFSKKLSKLLSIPLYHLDNIFWREDKSHITKEEFDNKLNETLKLDSWIIDGDYSRTYEVRISNADFIFFLDYDLDTCLDGIRNRINKPRSDIPWIEESFDKEFFDYVNNWHIDKKKVLINLLDKYKSKKDIITFKNRLESEEFLKALINTIIQYNEEQLTILFSEKLELNTNIIRYKDSKLIDMYDHNYYQVSNLNYDQLNIINSYSKEHNETYIKIVSNQEIELLEKEGFDKGTQLTMFKMEPTNNQINQDLEFKSLKENDIKQDLISFELKHYKESYGEDFCIRKCNRIYNKIIEPDNSFDNIGVYIGGRIVASCSIFNFNNIIGLDDLVVDLDYRHQGIATSIIQFIFDKYKLPIYLHADNDDTPKEMYHKLGFEVVNSTYEYFKIIKV